MPELQVESTKGQKTYYAPALLKVRGVSQYNADQISFEGLDGFWQMTEFALRDTNGNIPPVGTVAKFKLATNPKKGQNAKPGSMYQDIMHVERATDEEKDGFQPTEAATGTYNRPGGSYADKELPPQPQVDPMQQRINLGMAFNNLTVWLAHIPDDSVAPDHMIALWEKWFSEASRGLPLTPVQDEPEEDTAPIMEDAAMLDSEAEAVLGRPEPEEPGEDVVSLPW